MHACRRDRFLRSTSFLVICSIALIQISLALTFNDGVCGTVDLSDLAGKGVFALWLDRSAFEKVRIGSSGELAWTDKIDLCPDSLYLKSDRQKIRRSFPIVAA